MNRRFFQNDDRRGGNNGGPRFDRKRPNFNRFSAKQEQFTDSKPDIPLTTEADVKKPTNNFGYGPRHKDFGGGIKEWRIIVRNLVDDTSRNELKELFSKYGKLKEIVQLPNKTNKDGFAPFAFIQFVSRADAEKAIKEMNGMKFKERKISVAYSMHKDTYVTKKVEEEKAVKVEEEEEEDDLANVPDSSEEDTEIDFSDSDDEDDVDMVPKKKKMEKTKIKERKNVPEIEDLVMSDDSDEESADESVKDEESDDEEESEAEEEEPPQKKQKQEVKKERGEDPAVVEGRVLFLRSLPFEVDDEELKEQMSAYGDISLAITCKFKSSGHPTGTGFVHFKERESVDKALEVIDSGEGLVLYGSKIRGHRAVPRAEAETFKKPEKQPKDKRNLYLLRASMIRPGTEAANNMSDHDQRKRATLIQQCKTKLKLTTMFVSPTRLAIHNIPFKLNDFELRNLCYDCCSNNKAEIIECRIMRNKNGVDSKGKAILGKSKGFGFVNFTEHKDALVCLTKMNNNATLFTDEKRPIVEFSVENHVALNLRKKRVEYLQKVNEYNSNDVQETKTAMRQKGSKFLPKKYGEKIRHRDQGKPGKDKPQSSRKFGQWKQAVQKNNNKSKGKGKKPKTKR